MKKYYRYQITALTLCGIFGFIPELNKLLAQQQGSSIYVPPALERRDAEMANQREARQRDMLRESMGRRPAKATNVRYVQAVLAQVKEDFERVQILRNQLVRAASANKVPDYKFISDATGEVRKRASRLKSNLALPDPDGEEKGKKEQAELKDEQMKEAVATLCHRIESFVTSPFFETPGVVDLQLLAKANSDLKSMIELSGNIQRTASRLNKSLK
jgi:hypothetical protein